MRTARAVVVLAGCAGPLDPGAGNAAGAGTGTLESRARCAHRRRINADQPADFDVEIAVRATRDAQPMTTGAVTVTTTSGKVALTFRADRWTRSTS